VGVARLDGPERLPADAAKSY